MVQLISAFLAFLKCCSSNKAAHIHYANMLLQYSAILNAVKIDNFQMINMVVILLINFLFSSTARSAKELL